MATVQIGTDLTDEETKDVVSFLGSLTGKLPENFANAPVLLPGSFVPALTTSEVKKEK